MHPRIAYFDIENSASLVYVYEHYLKHGGSNVVHTVRPWFMLSFAWQERGQSKVHCKALCDYKNYEKDRENDCHLVKDLWTLFDTFDILIAHNGRRFDVRKATTRFLKHKLPPHSPIKVIDTLQLYKSACHMERYRLGSISQFHGVGDKYATTGFPMHLACYHGDMKAWAQMKKYNKVDVVRLAEIAEPIMPWCKTPDLRLWSGRADECPTCQSINTQHRGRERGIASIRFRMVCKDCGKWFSKKEAA